MKRFDEYLLRLSDESFFALYRNYLGPEESPYQKHDLIRKIRAFFSRPATVARMIALVDEKEAALLAAIDTLPNPDTETLVRFFAGDPGPGAIRRMVANLVDRVLVIRDEEGLPRINPLVEKTLREEVLSSIPLVSFVPHVPSSVEEPWLTFSFVCALRSFLTWHQPVFTRGGNVRRNVASLLNNVFPGLFETESAGIDRFLIALTSLETLQLALRFDNGEVVPVDLAWEELGELSFSWVNLLLWASLASESVAAAFSLGNVLLDAFRQWPDGTAIDRTGFLRTLILIDPGARLGPEIAESLVQAGVLGEENDRLFVPGGTREVLEASANDDSILLQANMEVVFAGTPGIAKAAAVSEMCEIVHYDRAPHFMLTERSVMKSFRNRHGVSALEILGRTIPQNVRFNITRWEERAQAVRIRSGVILQVAADVDRILSASPALRELEADRVSDGVYLFAEGKKGKVEAALQQLGLSVLAETEAPSAETSEIPQFARYASRYQQEQLFRTVVNAGTKTAPQERSAKDGAGPIVRELVSSLASLAHDEIGARELSLRIDRKLILFPSQLKMPPGPGELSEAHGLDYLGKVRIIDQAIEKGDLVEAVFRTAPGTPERILCQPLELDRSGTDLMLRGRTEPEGKTVKIRVRRISVLRRLSGTLIRGEDESR